MTREELYQNVRASCENFACRNRSGQYANSQKLCPTCLKRLRQGEKELRMMTEWNAATKLHHKTHA